MYALKMGNDGQEKFKARWVAKGYNLLQVFDYLESYSPTARMATVRMLMQIAVQEKNVSSSNVFQTCFS